MTQEERKKVQDEVIHLGDIVEATSFAYRMRYDRLFQTFPKDTFSPKTKVIILYNLNTIVAKSEHVAVEKYAKMIQDGMIRGVDKDEQYRTRDIAPFQALAVLNTIAHYNRFFHHHLHTAPISSALYFPRVDAYEKRASLVDILSLVCKFIPNVHMTSPITGKVDLFQAHVPNAISMLLKRQCDVKRQKLVVLLIGPTPIDWQARRFLPDVYQIDPVYKVDSLLSFEDYLTTYMKLPSDICHDTRYTHELINSFGALSPFRKPLMKHYQPLNYPNIHILRHKLGDKNGLATPEFRTFLAECGESPQKMAVNIFDFLVNPKDNSDANREQYLRYFRMVDFDERRDVMQIVKQMLPFWTQKLKDKSISSALSQSFERFKFAQSLNTEWLLEGIEYGVE